ncbi:MAG: Ig-like domain-containing protein [Clostridia bacterium]|nr:Ig-like domain-containing protein [Clostridia bacterium]
MKTQHTAFRGFKRLCAILIAILLVSQTGVFVLTSAKDVPSAAEREVETLFLNRTTAAAAAGYAYDLNGFLQLVIDPLDHSDLCNRLSAVGAQIKGRGFEKDMPYLLTTGLTSIGKRVDYMTFLDVISLPQQQAEALQTYLTAGLQTFGIDVSEIENVPPRAFLYWFLTSYFNGSQGTFHEVRLAIENKGLTDTDVIVTLSSALRFIGRDMRNMDPVDVMALSDAQLDQVKAQIIVGLSALGVTVPDTLSEEPSSAFVYWVLRYYFTGYYTRLNGLGDEIRRKGYGKKDMVALLADALKIISVDIRNIRSAEIMTYTETARIEIVRSVFEGLEELGIPIDEAYKKESTRSILYWFIHTYYPTRCTDYAELTSEIAGKGQDAAAMHSLLSSGLQSIGRNISSMKASDVLKLSDDPKTNEDLQKNLVLFLVAGLKALGVEYDKVSHPASDADFLLWFVRTYYLTDLVTVECLPKGDAVIDAATQTITFQPSAIGKKSVQVRLTAKNASANCEAISFYVSVVEPIKLDKTNVRLRYKDTVRLRANAEAIWASENEDVATVDEKGHVDATGKGNTRILATCEETGEIAVCTVEVYYAWWQVLIRIFLLGFLWY